jgi:DNA-binding GntR family transcriptional regulator
MPRMRADEKTPDTVVSRLRDMIISGELSAGSKVNEIDLSEQLGISRTPLREALRGLETEGLITSEHNRGFWIAPYDAQEVRELYPIIWTLEGLAVRDGGVFLTSALTTLREINASFCKKSRQPQQAARIDDAFHSELTRHSSNRRLLETIQNMKRRVGRYERIYMSNHSLIEISCVQHSKIIDRLQAGQLDKALAALEENWRFGMEALVRQL